MKLRNNTDKRLVLYFGDDYDETPTAIVKVEVGEKIDLDNFPIEDISIQEDKR